MTRKEIASEAIEKLKKDYPDALCSLDYKDPLQLLIATRLAAQCTDARVNMITPALFERFPNLDAFCEADASEVGELIRSCGFYNTKSKDIVEMSKMIKADFGGVVPDTIEELTKLPGVGRKTANIIVGDIYGKPSIPADTHCIRISGRLGLTKSKDPVKVEQDLLKVLPPEESTNFCHRLVLHGRAVCTARVAKCEDCSLNGFCPSAFKAEKKPTKSKPKSKK